MNSIRQYTLGNTNKITAFQSANNVSKPAEPSSADVVQVKELSNVTPDYNVRVPIKYTILEDLKLSEDCTARCYRLANGQKVVILPKDGPTIVKTYVNTGSFNEPDNLRGISHYIEHNLFNGSDDLGDKVFFDEVNKMGAATNASTSFSVTDYYIHSNLLDDTDLENKIKLHAGMLQSPKFLLDKLEKEKKIVNSEINMYMSEDENLGYSKTIKNLFNINSTSLDLVAGSTDNIDSLTRDDVVNYFKSNYYPANMTTVITGEVDPDDAIGLVSKYFTTMSNPIQERHFEKLTPIHSPVREDIISPKSEGAASVFIGFAGPENNNTKDKIHMQAAAFLAGGLANSRVSGIEREYGVNVAFSPERLSSRPEDRSMIMIQTEIPDNKVELLLKDLYSVVDSLSNNPPTEDELAAVKNRLKKTHNGIFESSSALNHFIGSSLLNDNIEGFRDYNKLVDAMTAEDIVRAAKKYFDLSKAALTVVHPHSATKDSIENEHKIISGITFTGLNKKTPLDLNNVSKYKTSNNLDVILNDVNSDNLEYNITLEVKDWTPKKAAVSAVLYDMLQNGGSEYRSYEEISKKSDILALDSSIGVNHYGINVEANFPKESTEESLALLNEQIMYPNFSKENFEDALKRLRDYYSTIEPSPFDNFNKAMYEGTPFVFSAKDKLESLDSITLDDIKAFYDEILTKGQGQVVVSAPFSKNPELKQQLFNSLGVYPSMQPVDVSLSELYKPIEKTQVYTVANMKNQAKIIEGFKFKNSGNLKDSTSIELLNEILGGSPASRLFSDLREQRHLAYSVSSNYNLDDDIGVLYLSIGTTTENHETGAKSFDNIKKSIDGFNENIQKLMSEKVSAEELDNAKKALKSRLLTSLETNYGKSLDIAMANQTPYGVNYINKQFEIIDSITPDDIYNTANYIFKNKPVYSLTATQTSLDANKEFLSSLSD